jgi:hypothetical protein
MKGLGLPGFRNYVMLRENSAGFPWKLISCLFTNPDCPGHFFVVWPILGTPYFQDFCLRLSTHLNLMSYERVCKN